ncbi:phage tail protein [Jiulongibacter sediminis]|uniref:Tail collar protein n=1 Tax=Jiulongibacter sediminis TaxID=1605367 RepID=A0A0N8HA04_9BACT|nr:tail fiber protein [Jiulongibacter sediminis]KPM48820.1 tail collar protein [Jiulongibacter sediminis]TBX25351.1 tail collar protein [Jiulongibacter sediminis]
MAEPFIAEIRMFAGNFAPRGWAFCNGQLLPVSQNTALFSLIGTTYGGDGRSTTALPNLQGRVPMHPGRGPGLTSRRLGESGGEQNVTLTTSQIPSHSHDLAASSEKGNSVSPLSGVSATTENKANIYSSSDTNIVNVENDGEQFGGGQGHNNMQPFLAVNFIIALVGLYPSRS